MYICWKVFRDGRVRVIDTLDLVIETYSYSDIKELKLSIPISG